ncbi:hypothetical protein [Luteibacter yeojuensis]|uniref:Uncharacterized protein n=1 Tax=Luteibacter yeojuensis TaxID=345309 RepID=A0A0F3KU36_9GAMM|nr:hypothetical protein [Luteibacter yeojuensis]KJV34728.1 hypothetical protein VI08_09010 [Luteibacter yeojuensis]
MSHASELLQKRRRANLQALMDDFRTEGITTFEQLAALFEFRPDDLKAMTEGRCDIREHEARHVEWVANRRRGWLDESRQDDGD